jgi:FKBP-type peptidyl-prolyl cis-trans isomerase SlyD
MNEESEADEAEQDAPDEDAAGEQHTADEESQDPAGTETESEDAEGLQNGDFVRLAYTARTVEEGHLVDTTDPEVAEEEGVGEDEEFEPRTIVVGEGHIFAPVEEDLRGKEEGDSGSVTVAAEDAFGEVDDDEIQTVPADKIPEDERYPGAHVDIDGEHGHIETIIGGRARVDFNHPLAGQAIEYDYEVLGVVEDRQEKAEGLLDIFLDMDLDVWFETDVEEEEQLVEPDDAEADADEADEADADEGDEADADEGDEEDEESEPEYETVEVEKETLYIEATPQLSMNQQWMIQKQQIAQQLVQFLGVDRVIVQETLGEGPGMMGGMGGMMGGMGGGGGLEEALEDEDVDAEEIVEELEGVEE